MSAEPLAMVERNDLQYCEQIIDKGAKTFIEVGQALAKIKDGRLYRETHDTFESYCRERWGFNRNNAYLLIRESEAAKDVSSMIQNVDRPTARELSKIEPEKRKEVVEKAIESTGGKVTAKAIKKSAEPSEKETKPSLKTVRFDECQISMKFRNLADGLAKVTTENRHNDLIEVAIQAITDGVREGAAYRAKKEEVHQ